MVYSVVNTQHTDDQEAVTKKKISSGTLAWLTLGTNRIIKEPQWIQACDWMTLQNTSQTYMEAIKKCMDGGGVWEAA